MKTAIYKTALLISLVILLIGNLSAQNAEQLYQKGIMKEEGEGSLREAIELYKSVADNTNADKVLRAKALYQMGSCYEKLGQQEARNVYEKLVANYTDPQELVANAKRKLSKMNVDQASSENTGITIRQITDDGGNTSPDGKFMLSFDDDNVALNVKDKKTGKKWLITPKGTWKREGGGMQYPDISIWSPDSKKVAYEWYSQVWNSDKENWSFELHIVDKDGTNDHIIRRDTISSGVVDWSPDGNNLFYVQNGDSAKLILISLKDGKEKVIAKLAGTRWINSGHFTNDGTFVVFRAREPKSGNYTIYSVSVNGGELNELITFQEGAGTPWAIPNSNQVIFISNHSGTNDLWSMNIEKGRLIGEPKILKSGLDETSEITRVLDNGTVLYSSNRLNPDFFYAKLDFNKNDLLIHPFRNSFGKILKTIWSPSLSKVAVLVAISYVNPAWIKIKMIEYDLKTSEKNEISSDMKTLLWSSYINPQWTPDEKSVLIKAGPVELEGGTLPYGIYKFNFSSGKVEEYMTKDHTWGPHWQWLQFSPDEKIQYFGSLDNNFLYPLKIIARTVETGEERTITQFDKEIKKFFLSPDGKSIAVKYENVLQIVPVDGNSETKKIECPDDKWGTVLGWSNDSKSVFLQKPVGKEAWAIWNQPLDGQEMKELISADKLKPFFGASDLLLHYIGDETFLSMQYGKRIYELWAVENIVQK